MAGCTLPVAVDVHAAVGVGTASIPAGEGRGAGHIAVADIGRTEEEDSVDPRAVGVVLGVAVAGGETSGSGEEEEAGGKVTTPSSGGGLGRKTGKV